MQKTEQFVAVKMVSPIDPVTKGPKSGLRKHPILIKLDLKLIIMIIGRKHNNTPSHMEAVLSCCVIHTVFQKFSYH